MTRPTGYSELRLPTSRHVAAIEHCLKTGEVSRAMFDNDGTGTVTTAYYRRNHKFADVPQLQELLAAADAQATDRLPDYSGEEEASPTRSDYSAEGQGSPASPFFRRLVLVVLNGLVLGAIVGLVFHAH